MTNLTKKQTKAMTDLVKTCLENVFAETSKGDHLALSFAKAGAVAVEDLIWAGWTVAAAEKTFDELVAKGLIHEEWYGAFFSLTGDWDTIRRDDLASRVK